MNARLIRVNPLSLDRDAPEMGSASAQSLPADAGCETCLRTVVLSLLLRNNVTAINLQTFTYVYLCLFYLFNDDKRQTGA